MAKELTHIVIAHDVVEQLHGSGQQLLAKLIGKNRCAYYLGSIIPDALFYDVPPFRINMQKYLWLSRAFHTSDKAENDQTAMGLFRSVAANPCAWQLKMAFSAGVITHTAVDRTFHELIEYCTSTWGEKGTIARTTHREIETLIDMIVLRALNLNPRDIPLERVIVLNHHAQDALFRFYVGHLLGVRKAQDPSLPNALKRAYNQQRFFMRSFSARPLYHFTRLSNKIAAGRLQLWHSLFYPEEVAPQSFRVTDRLKELTLGDATFSYAWLNDCKQAATDAAVQQINAALKTFC